MHKGFKIDLDEAGKAANRSLPRAIEMLRVPIGAMVAPEEFAASGRFDAADRAQAAYDQWGYAHGWRLRSACDVMDDSAAALREIIAIYRRVDGRI